VPPAPVGGRTQTAVAADGHNGSVKAAPQRVQRALDQLGLDIAVVHVAGSARTAEDAAVAVNAEVGQIVKSLVFSAAGRPVLALVSGANRLDTSRLAEVAGGPVERADAAAVRDTTGYAIGGVPPVGHPSPIPVFCDRDLLRHDVVWAAAGTPHHVFPIAPEDLVRITGATVAVIAAP
jgi:prolyl-tRNA editing enzyme YbaK/EbsC (Cys-tRNA(Pro) deacylase)